MFDIDQFAADCNEALTEPQPALAAKELVERAIADPASIDAALGEPTVGGMRRLFCSPDLTILQLVWSPHVRLFPHDHRMWAANGIYGGAEDNTFFRRREGTIEIIGATEMRAGDVKVLGPEVIHAVTNPYGTYTAAIHVYGGDYFGAERSQWDPTTGEEHPFDPEKVQRVLEEADARAHASGA